MSKTKKKAAALNSSNKNKTEKILSNNSANKMVTMSTTANTQLFGELSLQLQEKMNNHINDTSTSEENFGNFDNDEDEVDEFYPTSRIIKRDANGKIIVTEVDETGANDPFSKFHNSSYTPNSKDLDVPHEDYNEQLMAFRNLYDNVYKRCVDTNSKAEFLETFKDAISTTEGEAVLNQLKSLLQLESDKPDFSKEQKTTLNGMMKLDKSQNSLMPNNLPTKDLFDMATSFYNKTQKDLGNKNPVLKNAIADNIHRIINTNPKGGYNEIANEANGSMKTPNNQLQALHSDHKHNSGNKKKQSRKISLSQLENLNNFFKELSLEERKKIMHITRENVFDAFSKFELKGHLDPFQVSGFQSLSKKNLSSFATSEFLEDCSCCNGEAHFDYEKAARKIYDALYRSEKMKDDSLSDVEFNIQMCNERDFNNKHNSNTNENNKLSLEYPSLPSYMASEEAAASAIQSQNEILNYESSGRKTSPELHQTEIVEKCISWISANPTNTNLLKRTMTLLPLESLYFLDKIDKTEKPFIDSMLEDDYGSVEKATNDSNSLNTNYEGDQIYQNDIIPDEINPEHASFSADSFYDSLKTSLIGRTVDKQKQQYENLKKLSEIVWHSSSSDINDPAQFLKEQTLNLKNKEHTHLSIDMSHFDDRLLDIKLFLEKDIGIIDLPVFTRSNSKIDIEDNAETKHNNIKNWSTLDKVISVDYESFFKDLFKDDLACLIDIKPQNEEVGVHLRSITDNLDEDEENISEFNNQSKFIGSEVKKVVIHDDSHIENKDINQFDEEVDEEDDEEEEDDDDYNDSMFEDYEEKERIYNRCKSMIKFAVQFILKERLELAAKEQEAENSRLTLLKQLEEEEEEKGSTSKLKKVSKKKEKNKKKKQQSQQQEEKLKEAELKKKEEQKRQNEKEEKEQQRREEQRKKAEELKRKKDEQLRKKKEEQARRDEAEAKARRLKEEQKKLKEEERKQKQLAKEKEKKMKQEQKEFNEKIKFETEYRQKTEEAQEGILKQQTEDLAMSLSNVDQTQHLNLRRKSSLVPRQALQPYISLLDNTQNVADPLSNLLSLNTDSHSSSEEPQNIAPNKGTGIISNTPLLTASFLTSPSSQPINTTGYPSMNNSALYNNVYNQPIHTDTYQQHDLNSVSMNKNTVNKSQILSYMNRDMGSSSVEVPITTNNGLYGFNSVWNNDIDNNNLNPLTNNLSKNSLANQSNILNYSSQQYTHNDLNSMGVQQVPSALNNYYSGLMQNYVTGAYNTVPQTVPINNGVSSGLETPISASLLQTPAGVNLLTSNIASVSAATNNAIDMLPDIIYKGYMDYVKMNPLDPQPTPVMKLYNFIVEFNGQSLLYTNFLMELDKMSIFHHTNKYKEVLFLSRDAHGNVTNIWFDLNKNISLDKKPSIWA
ncbi:hypothetical protein QEN19_000785 [Hanseniaspora menglaensis]